jgi:hypothetical protein
VNPELQKRPVCWFLQPLNLNYDFVVSKFAFEWVKLYRPLHRGLYPLSLNPHTGGWQNSKVSFGAMVGQLYRPNPVVDP